MVMDNLPPHKATKVRELMESIEAKVASLSPYSPNFKPTENCCFKIKEYLQAQESRNSRGLSQAINKAIDLVTDEDIIGWFPHCCQYELPDLNPLLILICGLIFQVVY